MPVDAELKAIVQRMMDAGEPQENIGAVIKAYNARRPAQFNPNPPPLAPTTEPTTFSEGFKQSLSPGGSAREAAKQGLFGYLQGAIADLPSSFMSGLQTASNAFQDPMGLTTIGKAMLGNPQSQQELQGMAQMPSQLYNTVTQAGARPEEFGRLMGQTTGQPLVTAGVVEAVPPLYRGAGALTEGTGRLMRRQQPITGLLPRMFEGRSYRNLERWVGRGIEDVGRRMRTPTLQGEVVSDPFAEPMFREGQIIPEQQAGLPSSTTDFYQGPGGPRRALTGEVPMENPSPSPMHSTVESAPTISARVRGNPVSPSSGQVFQLPENTPTPTPTLNMQNAPLGQVVTIKQKFVSPEVVEQFKGNGFVFERMNEDGSFRFIKRNNATPREFAPVEPTNNPPPIDESGRNLMESTVETPNIPEGAKVPNFAERAANGTIWVDNLYGKGYGGYARPEDLNFIYDTARMRGQTHLPDPPPDIKAQMNPSVFGTTMKNVTSKTKTVSSTPASRAASEVTETRKWGDWEDYRMKEIEAGRNDPGMWDGKSSPPSSKPLTVQDMKKRYYELVDKSKAGTLTGDELVEARKLDKQLRSINFGEPIRKGSFGPQGDKQ